MIRWVQQSTDVQAEKKVTAQQATNVALSDEEWEEQHFFAAMQSMGAMLHRATKVATEECA
jgi:hypothetical protein